MVLTSYLTSYLLGLYYIKLTYFICQLQELDVPIPRTTCLNSLELMSELHGLSHPNYWRNHRKMKIMKGYLFFSLQNILDMSQRKLQ